MFAQRWSMKFEYLVRSNPEIGGVDISTFKLGVNYRF